MLLLLPETPLEVPSETSLNVPARVYFYISYRGACHDKPLYVYTSSVIMPLPLDLARRRLLGLLPNDYFEYLDKDPMGFCCRNRMNIIFRAYTASTMYQALLSFNLGFGSRLLCSNWPSSKPS